MDYRVALDIYKGPLDLLLYLIRESEVDIYDIPIATITEQYMGYLEVIRMLDPNVAGDFLVMASTLMEIKSRMLLPRPEKEDADAEDDGDPRIELIRQLMEYKKFKEAAAALGERREEQMVRFGRGSRQVFDAEDADVADGLEMSEVSIWDVLSAFDRVMRETLRLRPATIVDRDVPVAQHIEHILEMLRDHGTMRFAEIFAGCEDRIEAIGAFLALLEMTRSKIIALEQTGERSVITIRLIGEENVPKLLAQLTELLRAPETSGEDDAVIPAPPESVAEEHAGAETPEPTREETEDGQDEEDEEDAELSRIRDIEIHDVVLTQDEHTPRDENEGEDVEEEEFLLDEETVAGLRTSDVPLPEGDDASEPTPPEEAT